jgi:hypothetical protein
LTLHHPNLCAKHAGLASAAILVAVVVLAAGCGGDTGRGEGEGSVASTGATTTQTGGATGAAVKVPVTNVTDPARRAYIARVDRICSRFDPEHAGASEELGKSKDEKEAANAYEGSIALWEKQLAAIEAVPVPPGDKSSLRANLFDVIRRQLVIRRQIRVALAAVDVQRLQQLRSELDNLTVTLIGFARGYGFRVCGEGGD